MLICVFILGLGLIAAGALRQNLTTGAIGALAEAAILFPMRQLFRLRSSNIRLAVLPALASSAGDPDVILSQLTAKLLEE